VIANGVAWARSDRPRQIPTLLRYESGEFFKGQGYRGPIANPDGETADAVQH
jgi:hypothetical protein